MPEITVHISALGGRVVGRWYRSLLPDGSLWCETSDPQECLIQSDGHNCTFEMFETVQFDGPWKAWDPNAPH